MIPDGIWSRYAKAWFLSIHENSALKLKFSDSFKKVINSQFLGENTYNFFLNNHEINVLYRSLYLWYKTKFINVFSISIRVGVKCYLFLNVLHFLMTNDIEHILSGYQPFVYLSCSLQQLCAQVFYTPLIGLLIYLLLISKISLHIFDTSPLSYRCIRKIFSLSVAFHFVF